MAAAAVTKPARVLFLGSPVSPVRLWLFDTGHCDVTATEDPLDAAWVAEKKFEYLVSFGYRHIVRPDVIALFPHEHKRINLHISLLPYNRGADPNLWSILDNTPSGVTIHVLDEGLDTGKIVAQTKIVFDDETQTLGTSYANLQENMLALFKATWPSILAGKEPALVEQEHAKATLHRVAHKAAFFVYVTPQGWATTRATVKARFGEWCEAEAEGAGNVFKD